MPPRGEEPTLPRPPATAGFTLAEVMVALVVFSLAVLALLNLHREGVRTTAHVEAKVLAEIVAENRMVEAMSEPAPAEGANEGLETLAGQEWRWVRQVFPTADAGIRRIEIAVQRRGDDQVYATLTAFRGTP